MQTSYPNEILIFKKKQEKAKLKSQRKTISLHINGVFWGMKNLFQGLILSCKVNFKVKCHDHKIPNDQIRDYEFLEVLLFTLLLYVILINT